MVTSTFCLYISGGWLPTGDYDKQRDKFVATGHVVVRQTRQGYMPLPPLPLPIVMMSLFFFVADAINLPRWDQL
jgi:hypothetical protein